MNQPIYITSSIPYVNAAPHVGHAQEFVLADTIARLYRLAKHHVVFQIGTDENAFKNVISAQQSGKDPLAFVTENADKFRRLADALEVSYNSFIRTTEVRHTKAVQLFWRSLKPEDLYSQSYSGLYCQGCEDFYQQKDLDAGLCPDHKTKPSQIEEENTFFRLSKYQGRLEELISTDVIRIVPQFRKNEVLSFIRQGLQDISITRDFKRSGGWGIKVPGNDKQVVYVWIDALINYLSGQGYGTSEDWKSVWNTETRKIHVIGKNVWKFHAVYWPALLLSAGLPLPDEIIIHGFLTVDGQKISKSLGNGIDPAILINEFGADALRHYLLSHLAIFQDADFSAARLREAYNADIANNLGNLVSRLAALARKGAFLSGVTVQNEFTLNNYDIQNLSASAWGALHQINAQISAEKPWELLKVHSTTPLHELLQKWTNDLSQSALILSCFIPRSGSQVTNICETGLQNQTSPLFPRIETGLLFHSKKYSNHEPD